MNYSYRTDLIEPQIASVYSEVSGIIKLVIQMRNFLHASEHLAVINFRFIFKIIRVKKYDVLV